MSKNSKIVAHIFGAFRPNNQIFYSSFNLQDGLGVRLISCRTFSSDKKRNEGTTIPVGQCTSKDFDQPKGNYVERQDPPCRGSTSDELDVIPKECLTDKRKGKTYDETCQRPYVNPCVPYPGVKPCYPEHRLVHAKIQPCGHRSMMDECPVPDCPWDDSDDKSRLKKRILLALSLLLAAGGLYKLWRAGVFDKKVEEEETPKRKSRRPQVIDKKPITSDKIPDHVPYLLIGGGTSSFAAFRAIKSIEPEAKILVVTEEPYDPYMRPPLSKGLWLYENRKLAMKLQFELDGEDRNVFYEKEEFYTPVEELDSKEDGGIGVAQGWQIKKLDVINRTAELDDGKLIKYDKCLIATGAKPKNLEIFKNAEPDVKERVTLYRGIFDFQELEGIIEDGAKSLVVIGGGFLGSELACCLAKRCKSKNVKITQLIREESAMTKILPKYLSEWATQKIEEEGVSVITKIKIEDLVLKKDGLQLLLNDGSSVLADQVIVAIGVDPSTALAEVSDLELDEDLGGFVVNAELEARSHLYVAGDSACYYDVAYGRRRIEHHENAIISGRLAGENMAGGWKPYLEQSMFWSDLGPNVAYEAVGIVDSSLPTVGVYAKSTVKENPQAGVTKDRLQPGEDFNKGVVFYLKDDIVVGIVIWNLYNKMKIARQILKERKKYDDLNEVAKLFKIHG